MKITRKDFLRSTLGTGAGFLAFGSSAIKDIIIKPGNPVPHANTAPLNMQDAKDMKVVHSLCLGCNSRCGMRARVYNGMVYKVDGNPYNMANNFFEPISMNTSLEESFKHAGKMCLKDSPLHTILMILIGLQYP